MSSYLNPAPPPAATPPSPIAKRQRSLIPVVGFVLVVVVAWCDLAVSGSKANGWLEQMYRSVGLFTGNSSWAFDPKSQTNILFRILAVLAPLLTALGVTELATGAIGPLWVRMVSCVKRQVATFRRPVAIVGLTEDSLAFAITLANSRYYLPLVYAQRPDELLADRALRLGIAVIPGPRSGQRLNLPRRVEDVVSFLPSSGAQIDLAMNRLARPAYSGRPSPLRARLLMADRGLSQRLDDNLRYTHGNAGVYPRLIDLDMLAARLLLTTHPMDMLADALGQSQIHLAIYGFGALGRAVAKEAGRLYVTRRSLDNAKLRITAIDCNPAARAIFLAEDTEIADVLDLEVRCFVFPPAGLDGDGVLAAVPEAVTAHVFALGEEEASFAAAITLRRWLLEPPVDAPPGWHEAHLLAPIFIRVSDWSGLGGLLRSSVDHARAAPPELPDGIFAFGARETVLSPGALLCPEREQAAKRVHDAYRKTLEEVRSTDAAEPARVAEVAWEEQTPQFRDSNFAVVDHLPIKARAAGYRLVDARLQAKAGAWPPPPPLLDDLLRLEHFRWVAERRANGWRPAEARCDAVRVHPDLVAWEALSPTEQQFDYKQVLAMPNIVGGLGLRLAEALVVGVVGHRPDAARVDERAVRQRLHQEFRRLRASNPDRAPVLLTALAPGTDSWAAEAALGLSIPFVVPLPLPFELYGEDFRTLEDRRNFYRLVAEAEYYIELPTRFGRASELTLGTRGEASEANNARRVRQYALAGAYIVERSHHLIGVWDRHPAQGEGGTGEVLDWAERGAVPDAYTSPTFFRVPVMSRTTRILSPQR